MNEAGHSSKAVSAMLWMALGMALWVVIENIARLFSQHYSSFQIVWMRYSVHMLFMLLVFGPRVRLRMVRTRRLGKQMLRGMLMMGMHLSFIFAVRSISVHATMAVFWVAPLLLTVLSLLAGERANVLAWAGVAGGFVAVLLTLRNFSALAHPATLLALLMAACFVLYIQMSRQMVGEDLYASLFYTAFSVWLVLCFFMPFYWVTPTARDLLVFAAIGIVGYFTILGFDKAAELAPTWISAPFGFIQPVLTLLADWFVGTTFPGRLSLGIAGLIVLYLAYLLWRNLAPKSLIPGYHHA